MKLLALLAVSLAFAMHDVHAQGFSKSPWTSDSSVPERSSSVVWAYNFGTSTNATINGVTFTGILGTNPAVSGKFSLTAANQTTGDTNNLTALGGNGSAAMASTFVYNSGVNLATLTLSGLTSGKTYSLNCYTVGWGDGVRQATWSSGSDSGTFGVDDYGNNNGLRLNYTFTASGTSRNISINSLDTGRTWHFYGLALSTLDPVVTSISPTSGSTAGGSNVTITGTNFTGTTAVTIGGVAATNVNVVSDTSITCTTPAGTTGSASVLVTNASGTNAANTLYTYSAPPTVTPSTANLTSITTTLTITGTGFSTTPAENTVVFTPAGSGTVTASTATSLTVTSITGLTLGALNAVVTTNSQSSGAAVQVATVVMPAPGTLEAFNPNITGSSGYVTATALLPDGRMIIGGSFSNVGVAARSNIARLNADGTLDTTFTASTDNIVLSVAVQTDGKLVLGGTFRSVNGSTVNSTGVNRIARLNADGTLDTAFNAGLGGANDTVYSVVVQADGKLVLGGTFTSVNGSTVSSTTGVNRIARLNADGTRDTTFNAGLGGANGGVYGVALQADGKLVLGGTFTSVNGSTVSSTTGVNYIARLNADGTRDTAFNAGLGGANSSVYSVAVQADGKLVLGGGFTSVNGSTLNATTGVNRIARLNADGTRDTTFNAGLGGANSDVYSVALQADGKLVLGGIFTSVNGTTRNLIARLTNDAATQSLSAADSTQVLWTRGGAAPDLSAVTFEQSTNGGSTWTPLGAGTRVGSTPNWQRTGLSLPGSGQLRARGRTTNGYLNGGSGLIEQVASFTIAVPPTVASISPTSGPTAGGTSVTITGTNFASGATVTIGGSAATSVVVNSATSITCITPAGTAGARDVVVTVGGQTSTGGTGLFTYGNPEIAAFRGNSTAVGDELTDNSGVQDFLTSAPGSSVTRDFTIQNTGSIPLNLGAVTITGSDEADFDVTTPGSTVLAVGETTSITVSFSPLTDGFKRAQVRIASNDANENPFRINVSGTGRTAALPNVLVISTGIYAPQVANDLRSTGILGTVDLFQANLGTPSLALLLNYDAVIYCPDYFSQVANLTLLGNRLADFLALGGGVVTTHAGHDAGVTALTGRWLSQAREVVRATRFYYSGGFNMVFNAPSHPVFDAVVSVNTPALDEVVLTPGAVQLSYWDSSDPDKAAVAIKGAVIGTNLHPILTHSFPHQKHTGDYLRLLANALTVTADTNPAPVLAPGAATISAFAGASTAPGDELTHDSGTVDLGASLQGVAGATRTITVKNTGGDILFLNSITLTGAGAADFTLTDTLSGVLLGGASTTFTVRATPQSAGTRNAVIEIASNAANVTPFRIHITTQAQAEISPVVIGEVSSELAAGLNRGAVRVVDGTGLTAGSHTNAADGTMWLSHGTFATPNDPLPAEITFDLGRPHDLSGLHVWNYNEAGAVGRGARDVNVSMSSSLTGPFVPVSSLVLTVASGLAGDAGSSLPLTATGARYLRFEITSNHGGDQSFAGLSEVKFYGTRTPAPELTVEHPAGTVLGQPGVIAWGDSGEGRTVTPPGVSRVTALAVGSHTLALLEDSTVVAWGSNSHGQATVEDGLSDVTAIAASRWHSLALKASGEVKAWGKNTFGQSTPPLAAQSGVIAIAAGEEFSAVLKSNGEVIAWGDNSLGQTNVPVEAQSDVIAIAAGYAHIVALKSNGTLVAWGLNNAGQLNIPVGLTDVTKIAAGEGVTMALKSDGTVVAWGWGSHGQATVPVGLNNVVDISAGYQHSLALKADGTVVVWGRNSEGQVTGATGVTGVSLIAKGSGANHIVAYKPGAEANFGSQRLLVTSAARTYRVRNTGNAPLTLDSVTTSGPHAADFVLNTVSLPGSVAPGDEATFTLSFRPSALGERWATVEIATDDLIHPLFAIYVEGTGVASTIAISGNGQPITSGDATPDLADHTSFGSMAVGAGAVTRSFTISNGGDAVLNLSGSPRVSISGAHASDFVLSTAPAASIAPAGQTTFAIQFTPSAIGTRSALVTIASDASAQPSFTFAISAIVTGTVVGNTDVTLTNDWLDAANNLPAEGSIYRPMPGVINEDGFTLFKAQGQVGSGGITAGNDSLLITDITGSLQVIGQEGMSLPDGATIPGTFNHLILTAGGRSTTSERFSGASSSDDYSYLISENAATLGILSREGDSAPGGGVFTGHTARFAADDSERLFIPGAVSGVAANRNSGVWYDEEGDFSILAIEGDDVGGITGDLAWLGNFSAPLSAAGDGVAFIAALQNNPTKTMIKTDAAKNAAIFGGMSNSLELVARKGDVIPAVGKLSAFSAVSRSRTGDHAFISLLTLSSTAPVVVAANDQVLMAEIGGVKHLVARENSTNLTGSLKPARFGSFFMTNAGEVIYQAWLAGTGVSTANDGVLCRWTAAGGNEVLAREGSTATGTGLKYVAFQGLSVSPGGAVVLQSTLSSGITLMRALPGAALSVAVRTGTTTTFNGTTRGILSLGIYLNSAGSGGGGGGLGAAINDSGAIFTVLSIGNGQHVARVYRP